VIGCCGKDWVAYGDEGAQSKCHERREDCAKNRQATDYGVRDWPPPLVVLRGGVAGVAKAEPFGDNICTVRCPAICVLMGISVVDLEPAEQRPKGRPTSPRLTPMITIAKALIRLSMENVSSMEESIADYRQGSMMPGRVARDAARRVTRRRTLKHDLTV
jgi:hypothetical protein